MSSAAVADVTTTADASSAVGSYPIAVAAGTLAAANYTFTTFNSGTLTVNPATLTVTADNQTKLYGDPDPTLTATITGFVNGDDSGVVSGSADVTTTADASSPVGNYTIAVDAGTLAAANYTFATFNSGDADGEPSPPDRDGGQSDQTLRRPRSDIDGDHYGLRQWRRLHVVSGSADVTTMADASSPVGSYPIAVDAGNTVGRQLHLRHIQQRHADGEPSPPDRDGGQSDQTLRRSRSPTLTATITGFVNGEDSSVVSGSADVTTTADASSPVGSYTIAVDAGTLLGRQLHLRHVQQRHADRQPRLPDRDGGQSDQALRRSRSDVDGDHYGLRQWRRLQRRQRQCGRDDDGRRLEPRRELHHRG